MFFFLFITDYKHFGMIRSIPKCGKISFSPLNQFLFHGLLICCITLIMSTDHHPSPPHVADPVPGNLHAMLKNIDIDPDLGNYYDQVISFGGSRVSEESVGTDIVDFVCGASALLGSSSQKAVLFWSGALPSIAYRLCYIFASLLLSWNIFYIWLSAVAEAESPRNRCVSPKLRHRTGYSPFGLR